MYLYVRMIQDPGQIDNPKPTRIPNNAQIIDNVNVCDVGNVTGNTEKKGSGFRQHQVFAFRVYDLRFNIQG